MSKKQIWYSDGLVHGFADVLSQYIGQVTGHNPFDGIKISQQTAKQQRPI